MREIKIIDGKEKEILVLNNFLNKTQHSEIYGNAEYLLDIHIPYIRSTIEALHKELEYCCAAYTKLTCN